MLKMPLHDARGGKLIRYVLAGALTTGVSFGVLLLLEAVTGWDENINNAISVFAAVTFAYFINKLYVFRHHCATWGRLMGEFLSFYAARGFTILLEIGGVWLLTAAWRMDVLAAKIILNVIVLILNYVFSQWVVFRTKRGDKDVGQES